MVCRRIFDGLKKVLANQGSHLKVLGQIFLKIYILLQNDKTKTVFYFIVHFIHPHTM